MLGHTANHNSCHLQVQAGKVASAEHISTALLCRGHDRPHHPGHFCRATGSLNSSCLPLNVHMHIMAGRTAKICSYTKGTGLESTCTMEERPHCQEA